MKQSGRSLGRKALVSAAVLFLLVLSFATQIQPALASGLAIDGTGACTIGAAASSCTPSITTTSANDVLIIQQGQSHSCNSPTSTPSLTWTLRKTIGTTNCEYYAVWSSSGAITLTCHASGVGLGACQAFGVSGANTASPFDLGAGIACGNTGTGTPSSCVITTTFANDMIIADVSINSAPAVTLGSGFSATRACTTNTLELCGQYKVVSSIQTALSVQFSWTGTTQTWGSVVDAIAAVNGNTFSPSTAISLSAALMKSVTLLASTSVSLSPSVQKSDTLLASTSVSLSPAISVLCSITCHSVTQNQRFLAIFVILALIVCFMVIGYMVAKRR